VSRPVLVLVELTVAGTMIFLASNPPALAAAAAPQITVQPTSAMLGDTVVVRFDQWPDGPVAVGVCGNQALRGSQDCAVTGDEALTINGRAPQLSGLRLEAPPVPCPCVIRAATPAGSVVATTPIEVRGFPTGPPILPSGPASADQLSVSGVVVDDQRGSILSAAFAGPAARELVVTLRNRGLTPIKDLRIVSNVGRGNDGAPIATRTVRSLPASAVRKVRVPFHLGAPSYGTYTVHGTVYGLATSVTFHTRTDADPWALELMIPMVLIVFAEILRKKERDRRRAEAAAGLAPATGEFVIGPELTTTNGNGRVVSSASTAVDVGPVNRPISVGATGGSKP
jgi:hypothetical protein